MPAWLTVFWVDIAVHALVATLAALAVVPCRSHLKTPRMCCHYAASSSFCAAVLLRSVTRDHALCCSFGLKVGEMSGIVSTDSGEHIILRTA